MTSFDKESMISDLTASDLVRQVEGLSPEVVHALPFGAIRLDATGRVAFFSRTEAQQSGFGERVALGRKFFTELAPCIGTDAFLSRLERAKAAGTLDLTIEHVGDFDDAERQITIRVASASDGGLWVFLQRHGHVKSA